MRRMSSDELRESFLRFFEEKNHVRLAGASLIPINDPSILLIGAGMAPFKTYFTGIEKPPAPRVTTVQRCVRTPDMERVGKTGRHGTSFEMLGNFSFGDYFKKEAIHWAWEYLMDVLELPAERLYITVHRDDDEAYTIWRNEIGVPAERILRLGDEDNFWEIGVGPCGPDSEIFIDRGPEFGCGRPDCAMGCDCDRFLEIWNLVFTQYDKDKEGNLTPLSRRCIDTGMGLDRVAMVLQEKRALTEIDLNYPLLSYLSNLTGLKYDTKKPESVPLSVIADHLKGVVMLIDDGVLPGNEERSYVLRRLLRRAVRFGRISGIEKPFLAEAARRIIATYQVGYPELKAKEEFILRVIDTEERRFHETLESGLRLVTQHIEELRSTDQNMLDGDTVFKLHDTFGFPLELTQELLAENGLSIDTEGFYAAMQRQRDRARDARGTVDAMGAGRAGLNRFSSHFVGYEELSIRTKVIAIWQQGIPVDVATAGSVVDLVLEATPFYAEGGGEVGDTGILVHDGEMLRVQNTLREAGTIIQQVALGQKQLSVGDDVQATVDRERRLAISRHHSATHLLHHALRKVLGGHAQQSGSLVNEQRLRFDFSHFEALTEQELCSIEDMVNELILANYPIIIEHTSMEEARTLGATALFDEKYGQTVRVVRIGDSIELCGGCHVRHSAEIGLFHIISEAGVGSGMRRIEAVAGYEILKLLRDRGSAIAEVGSMLKAKGSDLIERLKDIQNHTRELERELEKLKASEARQITERLLTEVRLVHGVKILAAKVVAMDIEALRQVADQVRDRMGSGFVFLAADQGDKIDLLAAATKDLVQQKVHAGNFMREMAKFVGGRGGGRPDLAQGGGNAREKLDEAIQQARQLLSAQLRKGDEE